MTGGRSVNVRFEGMVDYESAVELMQRIHQSRIDDKIPDTLLILEHHLDPGRNIYHEIISIKKLLPLTR